MILQESVRFRWFASPQTFLNANRDHLNAAIDAWRNPASYLIASTTESVEATHYLIPENSYARYVPAIRYIVKRPGLPGSKKPVAPSDRNIEGALGLLKLSELRKLPFKRSVSGLWVNEITSIFFLLLDFGAGDDADAMASALIKANATSAPFYCSGEIGCDLNRAFYLVSYLHYSAWERERKKWNARADDLVAFGAMDIDIPDGDGDLLRHRLRAAGIHKPEARKQK